jgi:LmbE family N-acetylglucosaminyl deacetylase
MHLLLEHRKKILVLSPHLDDGVLSIGGIIAKAASHGADVIVATPFSEGGIERDLSPFALDLQASWNLGAEPYERRRQEDLAAVHNLGARAVYGQLLDSPSRNDLRGASHYPDRHAIFSAPADRDEARQTLADLFRDWIDDFQPDLILCPLGVGRHVDHILVTQAFHDVATRGNLEVGLYEDMPYATGIIPPASPDSVAAALERTAWTVIGSEFVAVDLEIKLQSIGQYVSQVSRIFPDGADIEAVLADYMSFESLDGRLCERIWLTSI